MEIHKTKESMKAFAPKLRTWKFKNQDVVHKFQDNLTNLLESDANLILESVEDKWRHLMTNLLKATDVSCGLSKKNGKCRKQTWWWDSSVNDAVIEKKENVEDLEKCW